MSTPGASISPSTSITRPTGLRVAVGQRVSSISTMSPGAAAAASWCGTWTSIDQPPVERHDVGQPGFVAVVASHQPFGRALQNAHDAPLGAVRGAAALDARHHPVPVHRLVEVGAGDEQIACDPLDRMLRRHESEPPGMDLHPAGGEPHAIGLSVAVAAHPDELAGGRPAPPGGGGGCCAAPAAGAASAATRGRWRVIQRRLHAGEQFFRWRYRHGINRTCRSPTLVAVGPIPHEVAQLVEEGVGIVPIEIPRRLGQPHRPGARQGCRIDHRAGRVGRPVDAVGTDAGQRAAAGERGQRRRPPRARTPGCARRGPAPARPPSSRRPTGCHAGRRRQAAAACAR